jgi:hypothetical protein
MDIKNTTLDDLAAVIGFSATLRISAWFGNGGNVYVPENAQEGQLLVKLIGMSAASALSAEWGLQHIAVPRLSSYENDVVRRMVGRMFEHGMSSGEVAMHMRLSERRVQQICRELECAELISIVSPETIAKKPLPLTPAKVLEKAWA